MLREMINCVLVNQVMYGTGEGPNIKGAKQMAALETISILISEGHQIPGV